MDNDTIDFDSIFADATAEVEGGGGVDAAAESRRTNAKVHLGDGEVDDPQADDEAEADEDAGDEVDDDDAEESEAEDETSDEADEDDPLRFDLASHEDELVTVKVNGEEMSVPLGEAVKGYMRQADYTRKTQEIAGLRQAAEWGTQMRDALLEDPQGVITALAASFGLDLGASDAEANSDTESDDPDIAAIQRELRTVKAELAEARNFVSQKQQSDIDREVKAELRQMQEQYPDFDPHEVLPLVIKSEGKVSMEEAYFMLQGKKTRAQAQAEAEKAAKARKAAETATKKRKVQKQVSQGSRRNAVETGPQNTGDSFADMLAFELEAAKGR